MKINLRTITLIILTIIILFQLYFILKELGIIKISLIERLEGNNIDPDNLYGGDIDNLLEEKKQMENELISEDGLTTENKYNLPKEINTSGEFTVGEIKELDKNKIQTESKTEFQTELDKLTKSFNEQIKKKYSTNFKQNNDNIIDVIKDTYIENLDEIKNQPRKEKAKLVVYGQYNESFENDYENTLDNKDYLIYENLNKIIGFNYSDNIYKNPLDSYSIKPIETNDIPVGYNYYL